ncbi:uncharacterized protein Dwil_GK19598, partial [Drosophila willistoni]
KSLSSKKLNNTQYARLDVVYFNRAAKVGSEAMMELLETMHKGSPNNVTVITKGPFESRSRLLPQKQQMIKSVWIADLDPGSIFIEHGNWLDFPGFKLPKPIYINLVRDPVDRVISWYYYIRGGYRNAIFYRRFRDHPIKPEAFFKKNFNDCVRTGDPECQYIPNTTNERTGNYMRQTLFFCGNERQCLPFNSPRSVQLAKMNVERDYAVVGSWEDTNVTLTVLEAYIPRFFKDIRKVFECRFHRIPIPKT